MPLLDGDRQFLASQVRTDASVSAGAEREVASRASVEIDVVGVHKRVGITAGGGGQDHERLTRLDLHSREFHVLRRRPCRVGDGEGSQELLYGSGRQVGIVSLRESIDTTTATGRLFLSIMGAVAQMERELRAERAAAGRAAARARGRSGGRPRTAPEKLERARILYESGSYTAAQAAHAAGIGRRTLFEYLATRNAPDGQA